MDEKITIDRDTLRALAVDTRIEILKSLDNHKATLSDLSKEMSMSLSTIKEHLEKLVSSGLIEQIDKGTKWKYYRLTKKGKNILHPSEARIWILLLVSFVGLAGTFYTVVSRLMAFWQPFNLMASAPMAASEAADGVSNFAGGATRTFSENVTLEADVATKQMLFNASESVNRTIEIVAEETLRHAPQLPYVELILLLAFAITLGICIGYLIKNRR
jgi:DNA-binding transcriptional ArsR family regulator